MTEQDDMENWNYAHAASRGTIARRYPYNYEQGSGTAVEDFECQGLEVPGRVIDITEVQSSEEPRATSTGAGASSWRRKAGATRDVAA